MEDKHRSARDRMSVPEPAPHKKVMRSQESNNTTRSQNKPTIKRKTVHLTLWVNPIVEEKMQRVAAKEMALQTSIDMQYGSFIEPMIERAINKNMRSGDARIISLLVRIAIDSGQTRSIVTNILGLQPDITPELLMDIIQESDKRAKSNITRRTPKITDLIEALEKWFFETERKDKIGE
jgi:hypothetical protein